MKSENSSQNVNNVSNNISLYIDRLCPKDVIKEMTGVEQILSDKIRDGIENGFTFYRPRKLS